jgi:aspartokinase/homoserine dehydrogenase 1
MAEQVERLADDDMVDFRVRGIANRSTMLLEEGAIELDGWRESFESEGQEADLEAFVDHVQTDYHPHAVIVDCTASGAVARRHRQWVGRGIHVVTPNKLACAGSLEEYRDLQRRARKSQAHYLYETTVGAGLPILKTLEDIRQTGDEVYAVEGILSGTLAYLFNAYDAERPFSEIVREAHQRGFTEPDPRDDLSGMDVARKLVILGREMGLDISIEDVEVEGLLPDGEDGGSVEAFLEELTALDEPIARRYRQAREAGEVLRYVGRLGRDGEAEVGLRRYPDDHAFARLKLTDNIVNFRTRRYDDNPLVVQGPGAGPEVTAGGIFADLLRLATYV